MCLNCPLTFSWIQKPPDRSLTEKSRKLKAARAVPETELMETASEGEGEMKETNRGNFKLSLAHFNQTFRYLLKDPLLMS